MPIWNTLRLDAAMAVRPALGAFKRPPWGEALPDREDHQWARLAVEGGLPKQRELWDVTVGRTVPNMPFKPRNRGRREKSPSEVIE